MTKVTELQKIWISNPEYQKAYEELAPEFELGSAAIAARRRTERPQEEIA